MTDKKKSTEAGSVELSEEELSNAEGGGIILISIGTVKTKKQPETAGRSAEGNGVWVEFEEGNLSKP